jgi:hypothetical protein
MTGKKEIGFKPLSIENQKEIIEYTYTMYLIELKNRETNKKDNDLEGFNWHDGQLRAYASILDRLKKMTGYKLMDE